MYNAGAISPVQYRQICRNRQKTYAISRFLAFILPVPPSPNVPISTNYFEIYITNNFVGVKNDIIFIIESLKFFFEFYFNRVLWNIKFSAFLVIHFIQTYCEISYKIQKMLDIWRLIGYINIFQIDCHLIKIIEKFSLRKSKHYFKTHNL